MVDEEKGRPDLLDDIHERRVGAESKVELRFAGSKVRIRHGKSAVRYSVYDLKADDGRGAREMVILKRQKDGSVGHDAKRACSLWHVHNTHLHAAQFKFAVADRRRSVEFESVREKAWFPVSETINLNSSFMHACSATLVSTNTQFEIHIRSSSSNTFPLFDIDHPRSSRTFDQQHQLTLASTQMYRPSLAAAARLTFRIL